MPIGVMPSDFSGAVQEKGNFPQFVSRRTWGTLLRRNDKSSRTEPTRHGRYQVRTLLILLFRENPIIDNFCCLDHHPGMKQKVVTRNVSLPASLCGALEKKLERHSYGTASEYVRDLSRKDLQREAIAHVDELLLEGLHSGPAIPMTDHEWQDLRTLAGRSPSSPQGTKETGPASRRAA